MVKFWAGEQFKISYAKIGLVTYPWKDLFKTKILKEIVLNAWNTWKFSKTVKHVDKQFDK